MPGRCECVNLRHRTVCSASPSKRCTECGTVLCAHCGTEHHVHPGALEKYDPTERKKGG